MSYMRGNHYLWRDDTRVHPWARDGYDAWDESGWMPDERQPPSLSTSEADSRPSGVGVHQDVMDEYVVMRFAELIRDGLVPGAVDRALRKHSGNGGCQALAHHAATVRHAGSAA